MVQSSYDPSKPFSYIDDAPTEGYDPSAPFEYIEDEPMSFGESVGQGVDQVQGLGYSSVEWFGETFDFTGIDEWGTEGRIRNEEEAAQYGQASSIYDIDGVGGAAQWAKETVGRQLPMMAPSIAGGLSGAAVGGAIGSAVPILGTAVGATIGGLIGAFIPSTALGVGEINTAFKEVGGEKAESGMWALAGGTAIGALDSIIPMKVGSALVGKFGKEAAEDLAMKTLLRNVSTEAAKQGGIEGVTEAIQGLISEVATAYGTDTAMDADLGWNMLEEAAAGAFLGVLTGGLSGGISTKRARSQVDAEQSARADAFIKKTFAEQANQEPVAPQSFDHTEELVTPMVGEPEIIDTTDNPIVEKIDTLTPEDRQSHTSDDLLIKGKEAIAEATGTAAAPEVAPVEENLHIIDPVTDQLTDTGMTEAAYIESQKVPVVSNPVEKEEDVTEIDTPSTTSVISDEQRKHPIIENFPVDQIKADPERFQFKGHSLESGEVSEGGLAGATWSNQHANVSTLWESKEGEFFIVNGHQRLGLAKRAVAEGRTDVNFTVRVLKETDGVTAKMAMVDGMTMNIADAGPSTKAVDVAKVMRNDPDPDVAAQIEKQVGPTRKLWSDAKGLSKLGDAAWTMVVNEKVNEKVAGAIGRKISDPAQQVSTISYLKKKKVTKLNHVEATLDAIVAEGFEQGVKDSQTRMFDDDAPQTAVFAEKGDIVTSIVTHLKGMTKHFKTAVNQEELLASVGNKMDTEANTTQMTDNERMAFVVEKQAHVKGAISDILNEAARKLADGTFKNKLEARKHALGRIGELGPKEILTNTVSEREQSSPDVGIREGLSSETPSEVGQGSETEVVERDQNTNDMFADPVEKEAAAKADKAQKATVFKDMISDAKNTSEESQSGLSTSEAEVIEKLAVEKYSGISGISYGKEKIDAILEKPKDEWTADEVLAIKDQQLLREYSSKLGEGRSKAQYVKDMNEISPKTITQELVNLVNNPPKKTEKSEKKTEKVSKSKDYGNKNKVFTETDADIARAILKKKMGQLNSGIDPEIMQAGMTLAGYHIEAGARKFKDFSAAMIEDLGDNIRPYLKSLYNAVRDYPNFDNNGMTAYDQTTIEFEEIKKGSQNATDSNTDLERSGTDTGIEDPVGGGDISNEPRTTSQSVQQPSDPSSTNDGQRDNSDSIRETDAVSVGEDGDSELFSDQTRSDLSTDQSGDTNGSGDPSLAGFPTEQDGSQDTEGTSGLQRTPSLTSEEKPLDLFHDKLDAEPEPVIIETGGIIKGDAANIKDTVGMLHPPQQEDVAFAEERFKKYHGVLFTNGTGTGKTFVGGGIVKRSLLAGKKDILVVVPEGGKSKNGLTGIMSEWEKASQIIGFEITKLKDTTVNGGDKGGVFITTYANMRDNPSLLQKEWDLMVMDEAHNLSANKAGGKTSQLNAFRAMTNKPTNFARLYKARALLHDEFVALASEIEALGVTYDGLHQLGLSSRSEAPLVAERIRTFQTEVNTKGSKAAFDRFTGEDTAYNQRLKGLWEKVDKKAEELKGSLERSKAVFLSATPWAYVESVEWSEGYLFDYPVVEDSSGYNVPNGQQQFMIDKFGYKMKTNLLNKPDAEVDLSVVAADFHEELAKNGALSMKQNDLPFDYERKFLLAESEIGSKIDQALDILRGNKKYGPLLKAIEEREVLAVNPWTGEPELNKKGEPIMRKSFDYIGRRMLLEALKAKLAVPFIEQHLKLGRQVVIFHDYVKGGVVNPFDIPLDEQTYAETDKDGKPTGRMVSVKQLYADFIKEFPAVLEMDFDGLNAPLVQLETAFPDAIMYNGNTRYSAQKKTAKNDFNSDSNPKRIIMGQSASMSAGISLHDTTGKHQRVLLNIGMPESPTAITQQEGRIYRDGQASNAIMTYINTGTMWEKSTFAQGIAGKTGVVDSFAKGYRATGMTEAFREAFTDATVFIPNKDEGTGGKAAEKDVRLSDFEKSIVYYFKKAKGRKAKGDDYFATPEPLGLVMTKLADIKPNDKVLEPSAGHGAISRWFPINTSRTIIEPYSQGADAELTGQGARFIVGKFEEHNIINKYDAIVMNPPFGTGGAEAARHLGKAMKGHLRNGGRIVAIFPIGPKADTAYEKLMASESAKDIYTVAEYIMPSFLFKRAGTTQQTKVVVLEKQLDKQNVNQLDWNTGDLSSIEDMDGLFARIDGLSIPERLKPQTKEIEYLMNKDLVTFEYHNQGETTFEVQINEGQGTVILQKKKGKIGEWHHRRDFNYILSEAGGDYVGNGTVMFQGTMEEQRAAVSSFVAKMQAHGEERIAKREAKAKLAAMGQEERKAAQAENIANARSDGKFITPNGVELTPVIVNHTKTGEELLIVKLSEQLERDAFVSMTATAKQNGGFWDKWSKGYRFKTEEGRQDFINEAVNNNQYQLDTPTLNPNLNIQGDVKAELQAELERMGLKGKVTLRVAQAVHNIIVKDGKFALGQTVNSLGVYSPAARLIQVALGGKNPMATLDHEMIHAIKGLGVITPLEWKAVVKHARKDTALVEAMEKSYADLNLTPAQIDEEIVAEYYAELTEGRRSTPDIIVKTMQKIKAMFDAIRNFFGNKNINASDVFESIYSGEMARRNEGVTNESTDVQHQVDNEDGGTLDMFGDTTKEDAEALAKVKADEAKVVMELRARSRLMAPVPQESIGGLFAEEQVDLEQAIEESGDKYQLGRNHGTGGGLLDSQNNLDITGEESPSIGQIMTVKSLGAFERIGYAAKNKKAWGQSFDDFRTEMQDIMLPVQRLQEVIKAGGGSLSEGTDVYLQETLMTGKIGSRLEDLFEGPMATIYETLAANEIDILEFEEFLYARHAPSRNARIASINAEFPDGGSGMLDAEAEAILDDVAGHSKSSVFNTLAKAVDEVVEKSMQDRVDSGLISEQDALGYRMKWENYVPLKGVGETNPFSAAHDRPMVSSGVTAQGKEYRQAFGRMSKADNLLGQVFLQATESIVRSEKNHVAKAFYNMAVQNPDPKFWTTQKVRMVPALDRTTGQVVYRATSMVAPEKSDYTITAKVDGKEVRVTLNALTSKNPKGSMSALRTAAALRKMDVPQYQTWNKIAGGFNKFLSSMYTAYNPEFMVTNGIKDFQFGLVSSMSEGIDGLPKKIALDWRSAAKASWKGGARNYEGEWGAWYKEWESMGGKVFFNNIDDIDAMKAKAKRITSDAQSGRTFGKGFRLMLDTIQRGNMAVESALRLAAYKNFREAGVSKSKAAFLAKELTVNFNRKGAASPVMNSLWLFFNASAQGSAKVITLPFTHKKVRQAYLGLATAGLGLHVLNSMLSGDDEDGESYYDKIPEYVKSANWVVFYGTGPKDYFKVPSPYGLNVVNHIGRAIGEVAMGDKGVGQATMELTSTVMNSFNPMGGAFDLTSVDSAVTTLAPTAAKPWLEIAFNKDFTGGPIRPEQVPYGTPIPQSELKFNSVSPYFDSFTRGLNSLTGGDNVVSGGVSVSPEHIEHLFKFMTGGAGMFVKRTVEINSISNDPNRELQARDFPVLRRIVGSDNTEWYNRASFYERTTEIHDIENRIKEYKETGQKDAARAYREEHRLELKMKGLAKISREKLSDYRKRRAALYVRHSEGRITDQQFAEKLAGYKEREIARINKFNTTYNKRVLGYE